MLGDGVTSFIAGDVILGGDGSDLLQGNAGDDILDGDKWLDVQIGVFAPDDVDHTGAPSALHNSMTTLAESMFSGAINPGQLGIVRTIRNSTTQEELGETVDSDGIADVDVAAFSGTLDEYDFASDGTTTTVEHVRGLATDGTDTLSNIEQLQFSDGTVALIVGTGVLNGTTAADLMLGTRQRHLQVPVDRSGRRRHDPPVRAR